MIYRVSKFNNGLRVATVEMPRMTSVSVGIWVGIGSRHEPASLNGVCHFIEHLLFKGTARRSAKDISQAIEGIGGYLNAFTSEETTCFHARVAHEKFEDALEVLLDMLLNSKFAPGEIAKERDVIKEEMAMYLDEPQHHVQELLNQTMWPGHPLGRPITGTGDTVDRMDRRELLRYLRANYLAGNTLIVAAGQVKHGAVLRAAARYARRLPDGNSCIFEPARTNQRAPALCLSTKRTEQTQIALGIRTCSRHDERRYALRLLNTILGENMSSRLFQEVRENRGLAYSIYSTPSFFHDTGDLVISAGLDTENLVRALRLIVQELRRLVLKAPSPAELRRARDYVLGQIELSLENTEPQMNWVGEQLLGHGRIFPPREIKRRLAQVKCSEIRAVARDFFAPDRFTLALVSPLRRAGHLASELAKISS